MDPVSSNPDEASAETMLSATAVAYCSTLNEAQIVVSLLASFGIEATIEAENYLRMIGSMVPSYGGIRVQVRQVDAEAAMEILNETPPNASEDELK